MSLYDSFHFELFSFVALGRGLLGVHERLVFRVLGVLLLCVLWWNEMYVVPVVTLDL